MNLHLNSKEEQDFLERCKHYHNLYKKDSLAISSNRYNNSLGNPHSVRRTFEELRQYGLGIQSVEKYKKIIQREHKGKIAKMNISWDPIRIYSKMRDIIKTKFEEVNLVPSTFAIDDTARAEKEFKISKLKMMANPKTKGFVKSLGMELPEMKQVDGFEGDKDIDLYNQLGGIMLAVEIMMKDCIDQTLAKSDWDRIKTEIFSNIIDYNAFCLVAYRDTSGIVKWRKIEPENVLCRPSEFDDHRDTDFLSFTENMSVSRFRQESGLGEDKVDEAKRAYTRWEDGAIAAETDSVRVMTTYFIDREVERYVVGNHRSGNRIFDRVNNDSELQKRDINQGKRIEDYIIQYVYKCQWVVGTDIVFNYGKDDTIVRQGAKGSKTACIPAVFWMGKEPSITERCIGFIDDIQIANYKIRHMIATLPPAPRMIIDKSKLRGTVTVGGQTYSILDQIKMFAATGYMVVESEDEYSMPGESPSKANAFSFMPSGITEDLNNLQQEIARNVQNIREVTGVNQVADGTNQTNDMLNGVMEGMQAATNNALNPHIKVFADVFLKMLKVTVKKWQMAVIDGEISVAELPISGDVFRKIKATGDLFDHDWGINIRLSTGEEKQMLINDLMARRETIPNTAYYQIWEALHSNDYKKAQVMLAKHTKVAEQVAHERAIEVQKAQAEGNAVATERAEAAKSQTEQLKAQSKQSELNLKYSLEKEKDAIAHERAKELAILNHELNLKKDVEVVKANAEANKDNKIN